MEKLKLGLIAKMYNTGSEAFEKVASLGIPTCQVSLAVEDVLEERDFSSVPKMAEKNGVEISCIFFTFRGQYYNLKDGPATMGLVAPAFREERLAMAKKFSDIVRDMGIGFVAAHIGFIPDDEKDPVYTSFIPLMREFLEHCDKNKQIFCFETGQELPSTLKRTIKDIGMENAGINLDPANLILYGKANPLDAVEIFGKRVKGMHAKDGIWPNRGEILGKEMPLGEGMVNFPVLLRRLKQCGYAMPVTIEREIKGPQQIEDIKKAINLLEPLL